MKNSTQPVYTDSGGVKRFKQNTIVTFLLESARSAARVDMNTLAALPFSADDRQHFAQLIGYSVSGYEDLSYHDPDILVLING